MIAVQGWSIATVIALAGCGFSLAPGGGGDDGIPDGTRITLTDDTAAELANNAGLTDGVVAARGALEPDAFVVGGLKARGFAGNQVADASTYDGVADAVGPQLGFGYRQVPADHDATYDRPRGLGITTNSDYTILYTGEILLPQGIVTLTTDADDRVVVQVALDGVTFGERLFSHNAVRSIELAVPAAGWYPIRAAYGQAGGGAFWRLEIAQLGAPTIPIDGKRLRARVTADHGLIASAFDGQAMLVPAGETAVATVDENYGVGPPSHDLPITTPDRFALRFAGQVLIDTPGAYTFSADIGAEPFDLFRIWIDGVQVANVWPPVADRPSATLDLAAGWHDLLVDFGEETVTARIQVKLSGPGIPDGPIDPQRLRPAVAFGLTAPFVAFASFPLIDATSVAGVLTIPMALVAPAGARIASVDYGLAITNQRLSDLTIDLIDCHGAKTLPVTVPAIYDYFASDTSCAGEPVVPVAPWAWRITDSVPGNDPVALLPAVLNPVLVATYWGGDRVPFAPAYTFVSAPKPTPGAIGFAAIEVTADLRGALMMIEMRAGADEAALASAPWIPVDNDAVPALTASAWVQYRLAVTSDGWRLASIDKVDLTYVVPAE